MVAPYLIPVCFCTESHLCSCSAREARCRKPTDPSCTWSRLYRVQMSEGCSGFEDLRGKNRNTYRNTALHLVLDSESQFLKLKCTRCHWCRGAFQPCGVHDTPVCVHHDQRGLLGTQTVSDLKRGSACLRELVEKY